jgi:hypothetical protein
MNKTNRSNKSASKSNISKKPALFDVYSAAVEGNTAGLGRYLGFVMATDILAATKFAGEKYGTTNVHCVAN